MARRNQDLALTPSMPGTFLPLAHPTLVARPPSGVGWIHEIKFDGYRFQLNVQSGRATWFTRNGHDWTQKLPLHSAAAAMLEDCVLDGELCALDDAGQPAFSALRRSLSARSSGRLVYFAFDILWRGGTDLRPFALSTRKKALKEVLDVAGVGSRIRYVDHFADLPGDQLLDAACRMQLEGLVSKKTGENYQAGRTSVWAKAKCRPSQELIVGGWKSGPDGRFKGLLTGVYEREGLKYAGSLQTGFADRQMKDLTPRLKALARPGTPFAGVQPRADRGDALHFVEPQLVAQAEIAEWTDSGRVRQASFKGLRFDKVALEVRRERPR